MEVESGAKRGDVVVGLFPGLPFTFPDLHESVSARLEESPFVVDESPDVVHVPIQQSFVRLGALRVTGPTPVPEATVEFVGRVCLRIVPVDGRETVPA